MDYDLKHVLADTEASMQEDKIPSVEGIENLSSILKS
jgi:hypothetical protein